jgi:plasmid stabilization system protein ParE
MSTRSLYLAISDARAGFEHHSSGTGHHVLCCVRGERLEIIAVFHGRQRWPKRL